jgi:peptidoglycan/LPS O-acetylase OafA/YrhL
MGCALAFYVDRLRELKPFEEVVMTLSMVFLFWIGLVICKDNTSSLLLNSLTYSVIGLGTILLLILSLRGSRYGLRWFLRNPFLSRLGILSYGVYLVHLHTNTVVFAIAKRFELDLGQGSLSLINLIVPFLPAYLMYVFIDERFAKLRHRRSVLSLPGKVGAA